MWRRSDAGSTWEVGKGRKGCEDVSSEAFMHTQMHAYDVKPPRPAPGNTHAHKIPTWRYSNALGWAGLT